MQSREDGGKQQRRGPETNDMGERELGVAAQQKLFEQADSNKKRAPERCEFQDTLAVQSQSPQREIANPADRDHQNCDRHNTPNHAHPERFAKGATPRKAIVAEGTSLDPSHGNRWDGDSCERSQLRNQVKPEFKPHMRLDFLQQNSEERAEYPPHDQVENKPPS